MKTLTSFFFAALGAISVVSVDFDDNYALNGNQLMKTNKFPVEFRPVSSNASNRTHSRWKPVDIQLGIVVRQSGIFSTVFDAVGKYTMRTVGRFNISAIREVLDNTGNVEAITYPGLFRTILTAVKKRELDAAEASKFFQWLSALGPPSGSYLYVHYFSNIIATLGKFENYDTSEPLNKEVLQAEVKEALDGYRHVPSELLRKKASEKITPSLTELVLYKGDNPEIPAAELVSEFFEDSEIKSVFCGFHPISSPPSGKAWPDITYVFHFSERN